MATWKDLLLGQKGPYGTRSGGGAVAGLTGLMTPGGGSGVTGGAVAGGYGGQGFLSRLIGGLFGQKGPEWAQFNKDKLTHDRNKEIAQIIAGTGPRGYGLSKMKSRLDTYKHLDEMTNKQAREERIANLNRSALFIDNPLV